jgi:hypothetical protein
MLTCVFLNKNPEHYDLISVRLSRDELINIFSLASNERKTSLAKIVLENISEAIDVLPSPHGDYQNGMKDGCTVVKNRLLSLFQRLNISVD